MTPEKRQQRNERVLKYYLNLREKKVKYLDALIKTENKFGICERTITKIVKKTN